jgi:hypothetical protein
MPGDTTSQRERFRKFVFSYKCRRPNRGRGRLLFSCLRTSLATLPASPDCHKTASGSVFPACYAQNIWLISRVFFTHFQHNFVLFSIFEEIPIVNFFILSASRNASIDAYKL